MIDPAEPAPPLPVHQLHQLRPAVHHRPRHPLRPPADDDGVVRDVPASAGRSTRTRSTAASTPSPTPAPTAARRFASPIARGRAVADGQRGLARRRPPLALAEGRIVAIKGIGGYHLACRADDEAVVAELRARKHREDKPFALMAPSAETALELVELDDAAGGLLASRERPIVLAPRRPDAPVAPSVAPASRELGVMLPYSPLHHLLLARCRRPARDDQRAMSPTSRSPTGTPMPCERLAGIADLFLIETGRSRPAPTTPSCAWSPAAAAVPAPLAAATSRATCRSSPPADPGAAARSRRAPSASRRDGRAWVGHHIGDLKNYETCAPSPRGSSTSSASSRSSRSSSRTTSIPSTSRPSTRSSGGARDGRRPAPPRPPRRLPGRAPRDRAGDRGDLRRHRLRDGRNGVGRGAAGRGRRRASSARGTCIPCACRAASGRSASPGGWPAHGCSRPRARAPATAAARRATSRPRSGGRSRSWRQAGSPRRSPPAPAGCSTPSQRSAGSAAEVNYEGQAAIELEAIADPTERGRLSAAGVTSRSTPGRRCGRSSPTLGRESRSQRWRRDSTTASPEATARACARIAEAEGIDRVVLSGGVFQNRLLLERTDGGAGGAGLRVLVPGCCRRTMEESPTARRPWRRRPSSRRVGSQASGLQREDQPGASRCRAATRPRRYDGRMRAHGPRMPAEGPVALAELGLQLTAMLAARVPGAPVDPVAAPDEPVPRRDVEVLAEEELLQLSPRALAPSAIGSNTAELTPEDQPRRHTIRLLRRTRGRRSIRRYRRAGIRIPR